MNLTLEHKSTLLNLSVELAPQSKSGLRLRNPVMVAAGTFGYGIDYASLVDIQRLGAIVSNGTTLQPRSGAAAPRVAEVSAGLLHATGFENPGVRAVVKEMAPLWDTWEVPVIVNLGGESIEEVVEAVGILEGVAGVAGLELDLSYPDRSRGGLSFGSSAEHAAELTAAVRHSTTQPLLVKLSPVVTDLKTIAKSVEHAGADALSLINTLPALAIDIRRRKPVLASEFGGLSGPAIKAIALYMVRQVTEVVQIPVVGMGGIATAADALEFIMAGATAIQVGTATFQNPSTCLDVLAGIEEFVRKQQVEDIAELIGAAFR